MRKPTPVSARPMHMMVPRRRPVLRTSLVAAALSTVLLSTLAGCADDAEPPSNAPTATETPEPSDTTPTETPTETPSESSTSPFDPSGITITGDADASLVSVLFASEGGGDVSGIAMSAEGQMAVDDFVSPFSEELAGQVNDVAARNKAPEGTSLWGAVAHIGCEAPASIDVSRGEAGFEVKADPAKETVECLVPVTYVVLFFA